MRTRNPSVNRSARRAAGMVSSTRAGSAGIRVVTNDGTDLLNVQTLRVPWATDLTEYEALLGSEASQGFTNDSGGDLVEGDVVIVDGTTVTTTTTAQYTGPVGVVTAGGPDGELVAVQLSGYCPLVNVTASVTAGNYLETSTTAGDATENATPRAGSFGVILTSGTAPTALLYGVTYLSGGGAGGGGVPSWFNIRDYGAVGDASTDDTTAINDAIAALNAAGAGVLYIPATADYYKITAALTTITVPATVMGDGKDRDVSRINSTSTTANIFTTTAPVDFLRLSLWHTGTTTAGAAIAASGASQQTYRDLLITGWIGLDIEDSNGWTMENCYLVCRKYGVRVKNTASPDSGDWYIGGNCNFVGQDVAASAALRIESSGGGRIIGNKFTGGTASSQFTNGLELAIGSSVTTIILLVQGNSFENVTDDLIHGTIASGSTYGDIVITGNEFGQHGGGTGNAIDLSATDVGGFNRVVIGPNTYHGGASAAVPAVSLTKVDKYVVMPGHIAGAFTSLFTTSGCTNPLDATGGVAGGAQVPSAPSGELGGTWAATTVDATHAGSAHTDFIAKAIVDAKGDLIAATAADTVARVAVGTDGQYLKADSAAAAGVSWVTPSSGGIGELLISDTPSTPLIFADLLQNEAEDDLVYADP